MKIIYTTIFEGISKNSTGIYETQVLQYLSEINKEHEVLLIPIITKTGSDRLKNLIKKYNINSKVLIIKRKNEIFLKRVQQKYRKIIIDFCKSDGVIICREVLASAFAYKSKTELEIIVDKRGIPYRESLTFRNQSKIQRLFRYLLFKIIEDYVFNKCHYYRFVSNNMANYYSKKYENKIKSFIIQPTGVADLNKIIDNNQLIRKWINPKKYKIIYAGGRGLYHQFEEILEFMKNIYSRYDEFEFYICSYFTPKEFEEYSTQYPYIIFYNKLPHNTLIKLLSDSHFGICFRERSIINYIAAPTKISEYLALNLKIIYSGEIGSIRDFSRILSSKYTIEKSTFTNSDIEPVQNKFHIYKILDFQNQAKDLISFVKQITN